MIRLIYFEILLFTVCHKFIVGTHDFVVKWFNWNSCKEAVFS